MSRNWSHSHQDKQQIRRWPGGCRGWSSRLRR